MIDFNIITGEQIVTNETYEVGDMSWREKEELREWRAPYLAVLDRATWFYSLTDEQKAQAVEFRQKLLDITITLEKPKVPDFIQISGV